MVSPCIEPGMRGEEVENVGVMVDKEGVLMVWVWVGDLYNLLVGENVGLLLLVVEKFGKVL